MRKKVLVRANTRKIYKKFEEKIRFKKKTEGSSETEPQTGLKNRLLLPGNHIIRRPKNFLPFFTFFLH